MGHVPGFARHAHRDRPRRARPRAGRSRHNSRGDGRPRRGPGQASSSPRCWTCIPTPTPTGYNCININADNDAGPADRLPCGGGLGAAPSHPRHHHAERDGDRPAAAAGGDLERHARSSPELNLPADPGGILIRAGLEPGVRLTEALGIESDALYDLEVNPNRPDAMSVAGVAHDVGRPARASRYRSRRPLTPDRPRPAIWSRSSFADPPGCAHFSAHRAPGRDRVPGPRTR